MKMKPYLISGAIYFVIYFLASYFLKDLFTGKERSTVFHLLSALFFSLLMVLTSRLFRSRKE
jgi:hypothetical protein